jgi:uncharacterized membrane protein
VIDPNNDDAAIAEFHAAARRRRRRIMAITAIACVLIGAAILVVTFTADNASEERVNRFEVRTIAVGIGFVIAGFVSAGAAIRGD